MIKHARNLTIPALLLVAAPALGGTSRPAVTPDTYARPALQVNVDGHRALNVRCEGRGDLTIMLEAGTGADSSAWFKVQPLLARHGRVCSYDRAGYGFSSGRTDLHNIDSEVDDLHRVMSALGIHRPVILVGHSMGTNIVRRYATRYPADVKALVLLDPPPQDLASHMSAQWMKDDVEANSQRDAFLASCEKGTRQHALPPDCLDKPADWMSSKVAAVEAARRARPDYWQTFRAELAANEVELRAPVGHAEDHRDIPITVLSAADTFKGVPDPDRSGLEAARKATDAAIAGTSSRSSIVIVKDSGHDIQLDQPKIAADAILDQNRTVKSSPNG